MPFTRHSDFAPRLQVMDTEPMQLPHDGDSPDARRVELRTPLRLPLMLHIDGQDAIAGTLAEVSPRGGRIEASAAADIGSYVTIVIAEHTLTGGRIMWREGDVLGVDFRGPLLPKAIARLCALGGQSGSPIASA
jgi:hypothetical protein